MATRDFVEDAVETLTKDPDLSFFLVAGQTGSRARIKRARYHNREGLEWLKKVFDEFYAECMEDYEGK
jgi:hypothetical protein